MKIIADLHCHTIASVHAYSTLRENINAAIDKGLKALAITDHGIGCLDSPSINYFENIISLPNKVDNLLLLKGVEANIMDFEGNLDIENKFLEKLDIVIASFHTAAIKPGTKQQHTNAYINIAKNPNVHIIGHSGSVEFEYDYEKVIPIFGEYNKVVEVNAHTFICREKSIKNCINIINLCKKYNVKIVINSDAHSEFELAECNKVYEIIEAVQFPEELIINISENNLNIFFDSINSKIKI